MGIQDDLVFSDYIMLFWGTTLFDCYYYLFFQFVWSIVGYIFINSE